METNFFQMVYELTESVYWQMRISRAEGNTMIVSILPVNDKLNDEATRLMQPMILKGTPEELNKEFFAAIQKPMTDMSNLFSNMDSFLKSMEEVKRQSKMEQEKRDKEKKEKEERKKKYDAQMQKVTELISKEKWGEAIGAMPNAKDFPEQSEEIQKKLKELHEKHGQLSLL
jgi:PRTRC genetic system protein E